MKHGSSNRDDGSLSPGDSFFCESCDRESLVKSENVMDGWRCVGQRLICAFCGGPLPCPEAPEGAPAVSESKAKAAKALDALADLLGGAAAPAAAGLELGESDGRFCKNCRHFLKHPFQSRCLLHDRDVEPMDDCEDFDPLPPPETGVPDSGRREDDESPAPGEEPR